MNLLNTLQPGSTVEYEYPDENGILLSKEATIVSIKDDWRSNFYNCIELSMQTEGETNNFWLSPWDIIKVNDEVITCKDNALIFSQISHGIINSIDSLLTDPKFHCMLNFPDPSKNPSIMEKIQLPMTISMIKERLEGNWYRSFSAIKYDARLLQKDAVILFTESSVEAEVATTVFKTLVDVLDAYAKRMYAHSKEKNAAAQNNQQQQQQQPK